jgi:prepilin-type N-terminal cleavage/methylation domain-containing protein
VRASGARAAAAGFSLVELLVGLVLGSVVAAAACRILQAHQRFYRSQAEILDVEQGLRAVAYVLAAELRQLDARDGDLLAIGRDSVTLRAMRTFGVVCAPPDAAGAIVLAEALTFGSRSPDPARDRVLVFADGDAGPGAGAWLDFGLAAVSGGARCSDGSPGTALRLSGAATDLARVMPGAPLRTWERTTYRLYADEDGVAWLGERHFASGAWTTVSPVAGPLRRADGLELVYRDSSGAPVTEPEAVARVDIVARALSSRPIEIPGRRASGQRYADSLAVHVALRNN